MTIRELFEQAKRNYENTETSIIGMSCDESDLEEHQYYFNNWGNPKIYIWTKKFVYCFISYSDEHGYYLHPYFIASPKRLQKTKLKK